MKLNRFVLLPTILLLLAGVRAWAEDEPYKLVTQQQIDAITYEDCDDDDGVTFPFFATLERVGDSDDRKKSFEEWKEKLEKWNCNNEEKTGQKVRNYISLMALVDILQMEWEGETPKVLFVSIIP